MNPHEKVEFKRDTQLIQDVEKCTQSMDVARIQLRTQVLKLSSDYNYSELRTDCNDMIDKLCSIKDEHERRVRVLLQRFLNIKRKNSIDTSVIIAGLECEHRGNRTKAISVAETVIKDYNIIKKRLDALLIMCEESN